MKRKKTLQMLTIRKSPKEKVKLLVANTNDSIIDTLKWVVGVSIPIIVTVTVMWWRGMFEKIKETGEKELEHVRKESTFEQTDAIYDYLLKNITDRVKTIEINHANMAEKVATLKEDVAVIQRDIDHLSKAVENLVKTINDTMSRHR